jgi:hypothetical protein
VKVAASATGSRRGREGDGLEFWNRSHTSSCSVSSRPALFCRIYRAVSSSSIFISSLISITASSGLSVLLSILLSVLLSILLSVLLSVLSSLTRGVAYDCNRAPNCNRFRTSSEELIYVNRGKRHSGWSPERRLSRSTRCSG